MFPTEDTPLIEHLVFQYQSTGECEELILSFENFIKKYVRLFRRTLIDFGNYDIRFFLSLFLANGDASSSIRRGKYHSKEDVKNGYRVLNFLQQAFDNHESDEEMFNELVIPFLTLALRYENKDSSFRNYVYSSYRYELQRHIISLLNQSNAAYNKAAIDASLKLEQKKKKDDDDEKSNILKLDEDLILSHPEWLSGKTAIEPLKKFTREERLILAKYYAQGKTDKDIGRLIGRNRRSVNRTRIRLIKEIKVMIESREINWMKLIA